MRRRNAWTLKALRALLACLCVFFALPAASSGDPGLRPVAAAFAPSSTVAAAVEPELASETAPERAVAEPLRPPESRATTPAPADLPVRSGRHLYLEQRSLLC